MGLYKRTDSKYYWMILTVNGLKHQESTKTCNKKLAELKYAKRLREIEEGHYLPEEDKSFDELQERYMKDHSAIHKAPSSHARDGQSFKQLSAFFSGLLLAEITPSQIASYKAKRQKDKVKTATIAKELELLRNALNLAVREWEWLETNPFTRVKIEKAKNKVERWLTPEEEKAVLEKCESWLAQIVIFTLNTGMRRGEVLSLKWPQIDLSRRTVTLLETKNGEKRTLPLNQNSCEILKARSEVESSTGYVFESRNGTKIDPRNLLKALCKARTEAGIEKVRFHDLRHTFATRLVQKGIGIYDVKELLGHKSLTMTLRYAHHSPDALRPAVKVLDGIGYVSTTF